MEELLARIRVTVRRLSYYETENAAEGTKFVDGGLVIDYAARCVTLNEEEIHLTPLEYKLLYLLAKNAGKVLTHTYITQKIWGTSFESDLISLRVFMASLRKKIEPEKDSLKYIQTHIGVGYRLLTYPKE